MDNLAATAATKRRDNCKTKTMIKSTTIMRLHQRLGPQLYEQRLQELRRERNAEIKQAERLSAILAKKVGMVKECVRVPGRAA